METEQTTGSRPVLSQAAVRIQLSSSTKGAPQMTSRFNGDGVRYKAKLIGVDTVPDAQGDKMCWDSMMKLKGCEAAARRQGKHKQKIWLNVSSGGLKIMDERTGAVIYDHDRSKISSLKKDESDPRALAYVYENQNSYSLFYIKTAYLADPVLADIEMVCQGADQETPQEPADTTQTSSLLLLDNIPAPPAEGSALEDVFSPLSSVEQPNQVFPSVPSCELMDVFTIQPPAQSLYCNQPESPQPKLSTSQILSIFPQHPNGGSPYSSPPYSPTAVPWGQQGLMGNQWAGPAVAPWPTLPTSMPVWAKAGGQIEAHGSQPGVVSGGNTPAPALAVSGHPILVNSLYSAAGTAGPLQSHTSSLDQNLL